VIEIEVDFEGADGLCNDGDVVRENGVTDTDGGELVGKVILAWDSGVRDGINVSRK
jgi:hypothetical protein